MADLQLIIKGDSHDAQAALADLQRAGLTCANILEREFAQLGTKSDMVAERQRAAYVAAYQRIKDSGTASVAELQRAEAGLKERLAELDGAADSAVGGFDRLRAAIAAIGLGVFAREALQAQIAIERINASLATTFGGEAGGEMTFLTAEADRLGLQLVTTADAYAKLAAASKGTSLEGDLTRQIFVGVTEAATALGRSAYDTESMFNALQQMISKGTVQAEELRGQLGERLPGAFSLAARAMGVTEQQLNKMLERGEVLASDLLPKLATALHEKYGQAAVDASNNAQQALNRMDNAWQDLLRTSANSAPMVEGINAGTAALKLLSEHAGAATFALGAMGAATIVQNLGAITVAVRALAASTAIATGGLTLLTGAVALLAFEGGQKLAESWDESTTAESGAIEMMKSHGNTAANTAATLKAAAEKTARAAEEQAAAEKKALKHRVDAFRASATEMLDAEKNRIAAAEALEKTHLTRLEANYNATVTRLDNLIDARDAFRKNAAKRNAEQATPANAFDAMLRQWDDLARREQQADQVFDPAERARQYGQLLAEIDGMKGKQVEIDGAIVFSAEETAARRAEMLERVEGKTRELLDAEISAQTSSAEAMAQAMIEKSTAVDGYAQRILYLDGLLKALPAVVNVAVKMRVDGVDAIERLASAAVADQSSPAFVGPSKPLVAGEPKAVGTSYIAATGFYQLHRGEQVRTRNQAQEQAVAIDVGGIYVEVKGEAKDPARLGEEIGEAAARRLYEQFRRYDQRRAG